MKRVFRKSWGAELVETGARFRLWAPGERQIRLRCRGVDHAMHAEGDGWFDLTLPDVGAGDDYAFVLSTGAAVPDPAARAQKGDVHGPSLLIDPTAFDWTPWEGRPWEEAVILEVHIGTFTPEGTFRAAIDRLPHLVETGITAVEIMPVAQFAGNRGWGYDGVLPYAPHPAYGSPDDMKAFIDACHRHGLMVLLDVVYNHFGPEGNYLHAYAPDFFDPARQTPWGAAIAYNRDPVRRFFGENALYWIEEYHLDGLRLDAVDHIRDPGSDPEILAEIAGRVRAAHPGAHIHLTTEDNRNITRLHERDGAGKVRLYSGEWNDDFHNVAHVIATGESEGYYADFTEDHWAKFGRALAEGFIWQGEHSPHADAPRGEPSAHLPPTAFVDFLQNHDQTGNRAFGERLLALSSRPMVRALMTIHLLSPHIPLLFMGEEWGEVRPFAFFTDFHGELAEAVREGRRREFAAFGEFQNAELRAAIPDPNALSTFEASRIDWGRAANDEGQNWLAFTRTLLALRFRHVVPHLAGAPGNGGRVLVADEGMIAVDWQLAGAVLRLRANLLDRAQDAPPAAGEVIIGPGTRGPLRPHTVVWTIEAEA
ncbi:malto-oligosyltrehalose trehalohydrolase [Plastorhodobacter daqingensis]|uniref:Malto-oligosyltrehalose trehalohydrolase n=1 Tax=Plastorhodobacter daqingensis TaxID=1387281 RepID=A0ABW2UG17_9RHOB